MVIFLILVWSVMSHNFGVIIWLKEDYSSLAPDDNNGLYVGPNSKTVFGWSYSATTQAYFKEGLLSKDAFSNFGFKAVADSYPQPESFTTTNINIEIEDFAEYLKNNEIKIEGSRVQILEIETSSYIPLWTGTIEKVNNNNNLSTTIQCAHISKQRNIPISRNIEDKTYSYPIVFGEIDKAVYKKDTDDIEYIVDDIDGKISKFATQTFEDGLDLEERFDSLPRVIAVTDTDLDQYTPNEYSLIEMDGASIKRIYPISSWFKNTTGQGDSWQIYLDDSAFDGTDGVLDIIQTEQEDFPTIFKIGKVSKTYSTDFYQSTTPQDGKINLYKSGYIPLDASYIKAENIGDGQIIKLYDLELTGADTCRAIYAMPVEDFIDYEGGTLIGALPGIDLGSFPWAIGNSFFSSSSIVSDWSTSSVGPIGNVLDKDQSSSYKITATYTGPTKELTIIVGHTIKLPEINFAYDNLYLGINSKLTTNQNGVDYYINTIVSYMNNFHELNLGKYKFDGTIAASPSTVSNKVYNIPKNYFIGTSTNSVDKYIIPKNAYQRQILGTGLVVREYGFSLFPLNEFVAAMDYGAGLAFAQEIYFDGLKAGTIEQEYYEVALIAEVNDIDISENIYRDGFLNDRCEILPNGRTTGNRILKHIALLQDFSSDYISPPSEGWGFNESASSSLVDSSYDNANNNDIYRGQITDLKEQNIWELRKQILSISLSGIGVDGAGIEHYRSSANMLHIDPLQVLEFNDDQPNGNIKNVNGFKRLDTSKIKPYFNVKYNKDIGANNFRENLEFTNLEQNFFSNDYVKGSNSYSSRLLDSQWSAFKEIYDKYKTKNIRNITTNLEMPIDYATFYKRYLGFLGDLGDFEPYNADFEVPYKWISDKLKENPKPYFGCYACITFKHYDYGDTKLNGFITNIDYELVKKSNTVRIKARVYKPDDINLIIEKANAVKEYKEEGDAVNEILEGQQ
jgi:hypothetical protein